MMCSTPAVYEFGNGDVVRGDVNWSWMSGNPMVVFAEFVAEGRESAKWELSRDMLVECLKQPPGEVFRGETVTVSRATVSGLIHLVSSVPLDDGLPWHVDVSFDFAPLGFLLIETLKEVPRGDEESEIVAEHIDALLEEILGGPA